MDTWRAHMPIGMNLKSEPYASDISAPKAGYDVRSYSRQHGLDYVERIGPLTLERFLGYADWFTEQLVPDVADVTVTEVGQVNGGYRVSFAEDEPVSARQVVVATGVLPYAHVPAELADLPADLVTHTRDHRDLGRFQGRKVAVLGAGQSAMETAALLHENGAEVKLVVRGKTINFVQRNPDQLSGLGRIRRPVTKLCEGWHCAFWNTPTAFRRLPEDMRITKARTVLGPSGSWWLKDRIEGVVEVLTSHRVREAVPEGSGVQLRFDNPQQPAIDVDHVIAGTGFRIDLARLAFLPEQLRVQIATINGFPVVSRNGESSVAGLYFTGAPTAISLGPSSRFMAGTHNLAGRWLSRSPVARRRARDVRWHQGQATRCWSNGDDNIPKA